jgi:hypothetical protein
MSLPIKIEDPVTQKVANVSEYGQLIIAPISYSTPYYIDVAVAATEYEVVQGKTGRKFVITDVLLASDKNFATATVAETVIVYQADVSDITTNLGTIFQIDFLRNDRLAATGLNLITETARSLVAIAPTSAAVDVTIAGYYIPI